jgi:pyruvate kinase
MGEVAALYRQVDGLVGDVRAAGDAWAAAHLPADGGEDFAESAANLGAYLALRHHDLRPLQRELMLLGLSSLGRLESRVMPTLTAVAASLAALAGLPAGERPSEALFFAGEQRIRQRAQAAIGVSASARPVSLLVTCPTEAAQDPGFMRDLAQRGVEAIRINCAHDDAAHWQMMIDHACRAQAETGHRLRILMDLAGPKIRTGAVSDPRHEIGRLNRGRLLVIAPPGGLAAIELDDEHFAVECSLPEALSTARAGHRLFLDDGKLAATIDRVEPWGLVARVTDCPDDGVKLKPEKGLNFPDTDLGIPALTAKDLADLDFVAAHADGIGLSFVQTAADVALLQAALAERRPDWDKLALVLKIEMPQAVTHLPDILVQAAARQPTAVMIARGDLAVEIGFARLAEMQEEILWLCEAAQVPVIWATQVLEHLIKEGTPVRGEMTDAAMSARADCVMLNKGPHLLQAIDVLDTLLRRMDEHQHKKTPQLRALKSWWPAAGA